MSGTLRKTDTVLQVVAIVALAHFVARPTWESVVVVALFVAACVFMEWREQAADDVRGRLAAHEAALADLDKAVKRHGERFDQMQAATPRRSPSL